MTNADLQPRYAEAGLLRVSLHHELTDRLRDMIVEGRLAPGMKVPEKELCLQLGVSRTPLRESLKVLASEGLILLSPNRGAAVARLTREEITEIFPILGALEALAGALACERVTPADIERLTSLQMQMAAHFAADNLPAYFKCNQAVHAAILEIAGNAALCAVHNSLSLRIRRYRYAANLAKTRWREAIDEHQSILDAMSSRNASEISRLLRAHFENKLSAVLCRVDRDPNFD